MVVILSACAEDELGPDTNFHLNPFIESKVEETNEEQEEADVDPDADPDETDVDPDETAEESVSNEAGDVCCCRDAYTASALERLCLRTVLTERYHT